MHNIYFFRKGSNISYEADVNKTPNLSELMRVRENEETIKSRIKQTENNNNYLNRTNNQNEDYLKFQKQKIEHALASVLDDMKQLSDTNTLVNHRKSSNKNSSITFNNNQSEQKNDHNGNGFGNKNLLMYKNNEKEEDEDEDDYVEPPDSDDLKNFYDDDSNDILLSSSTSTSTTSTTNTSNNHKQANTNSFNGKLSELIMKSIGKTTNLNNNSNTMSPTQSSHNTFKGNKEILNKSIEEIKNLMQNETTPTLSNIQQQQMQNSLLLAKSMQKTQDAVPSSFTLKSPCLNTPRLNGSKQAEQKSLLIETDTLPNRFLNLNLVSSNLNSANNASNIASPIMSTNSTLTKNSSIFNNPNSNNNNSTKLKTNSTSTPIRNSTNDISEDIKQSKIENQSTEVMNTEQQKTPVQQPPPIMRKPENADELLRKLASLKTSPDGNLTIRLSKSRATDV